MSEQSSQSSAVVAFRGLVMLACLVAIPLAAIFGTSLPGVFRAIKEGKWPVLSMAQAQSTSNETPRFVPTGAANGQPLQTPGPSVDSLFRASEAADLPKLPNQWPAAGGSSGPTGVVQAGYTVPVDSTKSPGNPADRGSGDDRNRTGLLPFGAGNGELVPVQRGGQVPPDATGLAAADRSENRAAPASDPFRSIQDRLRQFGATYYLLESWGDQKREFRFFCRMAVGGNPNYTRPFWAIDSDPLRAMSQVLEQVELWRANLAANP